MLSAGPSRKITRSLAEYNPVKAGRKHDACNKTRVSLVAWNVPEEGGRGWGGRSNVLGFGV